LGGNVGIGTSNPSGLFTVRDSANSENILTVNSGANRGVTIAGEDTYSLLVYGGSVPLYVDRSGNGNLVTWVKNGAAVGYVSVSASTVSYGAFTGTHNGKILEDEIIEGAVVTISKCSMPEGSNQPEYEFKYATTANDSNVLGVVGSTTELDLGEVQPDNNEQYIIFAIGDGGILVTDSEGDISAGDYLTSSSRSGHAVPQDTGAMMNYSIAKSLIDVDWSGIEVDADLGFKSKYVPCTYHCG
jgi:hypothetical protein